MNLDPDALKREIDEVLEEIDRVEAEVLELFADIGGPEALQKVVGYKRQQERLSPLAKREESPGPSSSPPATR